MKWLRYFVCLLPGLFGCSPKQTPQWTSPPSMVNFSTMTFQVDDAEYQYIEVQDVKGDAVRSTILVMPRQNPHEKEYALVSVSESGVLLGYVIDQMMIIEADWSSVCYVLDWRRKDKYMFTKKSFREIGITEEMMRPIDRIPHLETMIREHVKPNAVQE